MYAHCTLYTVQCTVYSVQCTVYSVQCTVYNVQCTMYSVQCTVYNVQCTMYSVQCTVYNVQCTMYSELCTVYNVQCTIAHIFHSLTITTTMYSYLELRGAVSWRHFLFGQSSLQISAVVGVFTFWSRRNPSTLKMSCNTISIRLSNSPPCH